jgi:hypothetical protein
VGQGQLPRLCSTLLCKDVEVVQLMCGWSPLGAPKHIVRVVIRGRARDL